MIPNKDQVNSLLKKYAPNDEYLVLVKTHGKIVAEIALEIANRIDSRINLDVLESACLLHDIGSCVFIEAANSNKEFQKSYPGHAILGAKILQDEGVSERVWRAVETHVLLGLSKEEIVEQGIALPFKNYFPETIEARLLCYADRFHSKHPRFNDFEKFSTGLFERLPEQGKKFNEWSKEFGVPDIKALSKKYGHPIK